MAVVRRTSCPWLGWLALALVWLFAAPARAAGADATPGFDIAPAPRWVESVEPNGSSFARDGALGGVAMLVLDMQRVISEDSDWSYIHTVQEITNEAGVAALGELTFEFSPPHERLVLHRVEILRDGAVLSRLSPGAVQVLQRERSLEERLYDGGQTAVIVLPDVRVGDVIVREFSIVGRNPVFGHDTAAHLTLEFAAPVGVVHASVPRLRLLDPATRVPARVPRLARAEPRGDDHRRAAGAGAADRAGGQQHPSGDRRGRADGGLGPVRHRVFARALAIPAASLRHGGDALTRDAAVRAAAYSRPWRSAAHLRPPSRPPRR